MTYLKSPAKSGLGRESRAATDRLELVGASGDATV